MSQPQHEREAGLLPCDICGMVSHVQEGLCVNCRHKATWPNSDGAAALDKCQPGEKPGSRGPITFITIAAEQFQEPITITRFLDGSAWPSTIGPRPWPLSGGRD